MVVKLAMAIATAGYVGYAPFAPGTFGSAVGLLVYAAVRTADSALAELAAMAAALVFGTWSADVAERQLGKDPHPVVIDEVLGMLITVAFLDVTILGGIVGFFLFRLLDVLKPWPAGRLEHLHGGPGIMLDDAMAGVYSHLLLRGAIAVWPGWLA
jgi:phosphatidylglycerophosphatase A